MRIEFDNKTTVELNVLGYEFPETRDFWNEYDANWLVVSVKVDSPEYKWEAEDPSLLAWELEEITDWFRALERNQKVDEELCFLEPCLSFHHALNPQGKHQITLTLAYELRPREMEQKSISFTKEFTIDDLKRFADEFEKEQKRFPKRKRPNGEDW